MERSFPFNSLAGDRTYFAEDFASSFGLFFGNGVFNNGLQVVAKTLMNVTVKIGAGFIDGQVYFNKDDKDIHIDVADGSLDRIDSVVMQLNYDTREIKSIYKKGSIAALPVPPTLINTDLIKELRLCNINVNRGVTTITQSMITDTRFTNDCGNVINAIQTPNFSDLYIQFTAIFDSWHNNLLSQFDDDLIAGLMKEIDLSRQQMAAGVPIGSVVAHAGLKTSIPKEYLAAEGQAVSKLEYPTLFERLGYTFGGSGDTFNLPDLRDRVVAGVGNQEPFIQLAKTSGSITHQLVSLEMPTHTHTQDSHNHTQAAHTHTQDSHNHTQVAHTHTQNAHTHTQDSHNHTQNSHNHTQNAHTHTQNAHSHTTNQTNGRYLLVNVSGATGSVATGTGLGGYSMQESTQTATAVNQNATPTNVAFTATNNAQTATNQNTTAVNQNATPTNNASVATNQNTTATNTAFTATNQNTGGGQSHNNIQPSMALFYIIKVKESPWADDVVSLDDRMDKIDVVDKQVFTGNVDGAVSTTTCRRQ